MKKYNLAAGDFPDIQSFGAKLNEVKFSEFSTLSQKQIDELDIVLNVDIPKLMAVGGAKWCCIRHLLAQCAVISLVVVRRLFSL